MGCYGAMLIGAELTGKPPLWGIVPGSAAPDGSPDLPDEKARGIIEVLYEVSQGRIALDTQRRETR
jgi:hypothetical protein